MPPDPHPTGRAALDRPASPPIPHVLARLTPDDLYPARLAGPHAWHPWALTTAPPTDRHIRLALPTSTSPDRARRLLGHLTAKLTAPPWPPDPPLSVHRQDASLHCHTDHPTWHATIELDTPTPDRPTTRTADVVDRDGWPILDELAALNDRIQHITRRSHTAADIADLARWVEHKMAPGRATRVATPLADLLQHHAAAHPRAAHRLDRLLEHLTETAPARNLPALTYLQHQLRHAHQTTRPRVAVR